MMVIDLFSFLLTGLFMGSLLYGILYIFVIGWAVSNRYYVKIWIACVLMTYIAYAHEFLRKQHQTQEFKTQTIAERYEQVKDAD